MFCWTVANNLNSVRFDASLTQVAWTLTLRWRVLIGQYQETWPYYTRKPDTRANRDTGIQPAVTIKGSENGQSISFQNLLGASHLFMLCDLTLSIETVRQSSVIILPDYCTPLSCHYGQKNIQGYKIKVQPENISASHLSSQPVMMTGWLVSGIVYGYR